MSISGKSGDLDEQQQRQRKRYALFNDPDIIAKRAEVSAITTLKNQQQYLRLRQQQTQQTRRYVNNVSNREDVKNIGSLLNCRVQPYPFTFITAVKKKLALAAKHDCSCIKSLNSTFNDQTLIHSTLIDSEIQQIPSEHRKKTKKMDFIKPLKVPDLKISPKTLDYSSGENSLHRNATQKSEKIPTKGSFSERAHRKLDFSLSPHGGGVAATAFITNDGKSSKLQQQQLAISTEGLIMKKKESIRDSSRERENRTKRMKKDDSNSCKGESESPQDSGKRAKSSKNIQRKDATTSSDSLPMRFVAKNERVPSSHRENDLVGLKKIKTKNAIAAPTRKEDGRKSRPSSYAIKISRDRSTENRGRTSSDSVSVRNSKIQKYNDNYQNHPIVLKEHQHNKILDKSKPSTSKAHHLSGGYMLELSDEIDSTPKSNSNESNNIYTELSQQLKTRSDRLSKSSQISSHLTTKSLNSADNSRYIHKILRNDISSSSSLNAASTTEHRMNDQKLLSNSNVSDELPLDPRKISFRDNSYSQQAEFCNLVTPDLNLIYRPIRRKDQRPLQTFSEPEIEIMSPAKHKPQRLTQVQTEDSIPMLHPTALHMQFQAELHLFDSYNESIRQVMDVENSLYNARQHEERDKEQISKLTVEGTQIPFPIQPYDESIDNDGILSINSAPEMIADREIDCEMASNKMEFINEIKERRMTTTMTTATTTTTTTTATTAAPNIKMAAVHTQTANDIATQTDALKLTRQNLDNRELMRQYPGITYSRGSSNDNFPPQVSLLSLNDDFDEDIEDRLEEISLPNKTVRTMSEISLHETTSSIKTETGTEISISTRDVTCSFNKYLDLEMAQLIRDEKQMYDKIEMLFKSREKILNDRTRKLVKLEEQKRALRDTGQDSRISSVKKKQRALLLKLQQEKDEMNRLKELHKLASQERKLMLQKQRNMFNPQMSTKNILTKLKRSADCQSPRRLSGPMKGYDIRSNSSISSLIDSDKSQLDRSNFETKTQLSDGAPKISSEQCCKSDIDISNNIQGIKTNKYPKLMEESTSNSSNVDLPQRYEIKTRKFEEKMPKCDALLRLKTHHMELESKLLQARQESSNNLSLPDSHDGKSESDTIVEELSKKPKISRDRDSSMSVKKSQYNSESMKGNNNKRKGTRNMKVKSTTNLVTENEMRFKSNVQNSDDMLKHNKRSKIESDILNMDGYCPNSILEEINLNDSENSLQALVKHSRAVKEKNYEILRDIANENDAKENILCGIRHDNSCGNGINRDDSGADLQQNLGNISTRSQVSTFTISRHSSGDSEKSYSRSVVIRSQDHQFKTPKKLEQILHAREAALATRRNCVEDWIAWHAKLKAEESRVARMEEAAYKLVSATTNVLSCHDTTVSTDASDVEGRVELLAEKLSERRAEMAKLKKEARRQAKQRLKALEANLLNQIKKYDMTIHEMRKKLDINRGSKDDGKLAIEAKSIADFKVPEIPIKHIQEICRNSDMLRSHSESDLIAHNTYSEMQSGSNTNIEQNFPSASSLESKSTAGQSRLQSDRLTKYQSRSIESILEEAKNVSSACSTIQNNFQSCNDIGSVNDNTNLNGNLSENVDSERNKSILDAIQSSEICTNLAHAKSFDSNVDMKIHDSPRNYIAEEITNGEHATFSKKIDFLQLNNKNLSDDINTLENDLKTLSEMMSRFSKKSDDRIRQTLNSNSNASIESDKGTSRDITEELTGVSEKIGDTEEIVDEVVEFSPTIESYESSQLNNSQSHSSRSNDGIISGVSSKEEFPGAQSTDNIDFEARSKEILNVIEQSIISDHIKMSEINFDLTGAALEKSMQNLHKENEALSSDFNSLEGDIKSISKIISKMAESNRNSYTAMDNTSSGTLDMSCESKNDTTIEEIDRINEERVSSQSETAELNDEYKVSTNFTTDNIVEQSNSSVENGISQEECHGNNRENEHYAISVDKPNFEDTQDDGDTENMSHKRVSEDWSISRCFEVSGGSQETGSRQIVDELIEHPDYLSMNSNKSTTSPEKQDENINKKDISYCTADIDDIMYIPYGESKNVYHEVKATIDEAANLKHVDTDELDDILDIIENENKQENESNKKFAEVPDELQLKIHDESLISPMSNELNITVDVEPVLQKLTEILQSVERNIAKRTQNRESDIDLPQFTDMNIVGRDNDGISNEFSVSNSLVLNDESHNSIPQNSEDISNNNELRRSTVATHESSIVKDPEYEDISEESLEVSEILDKSASQKSNSQRSSRIPEKYEAIPKTDDVLRILDQISKQSTLKVVRQSNQHLQDVQVSVQVFGDISPYHVNNQDTNLRSVGPEDNVESRIIIENDELVSDDANKSYNDPDHFVHVSHNEKTGDVSLVSSQDADTPRGVSEIDMDSPRDQNDSRLDIDILDDDLLTGVTERSDDCKGKFQSGSTIINSERDIEIMIEKLRASLDQPGLEVAELDARLLRLEQLQIELQIKKLEAEEVAFYVREIPNKPPPPYTPPNVGSLSSPEPSPTLPRAVVPSNIDELTAFTERATSILYNAKQNGMDIMSLEAPSEICQLNKDTNGIAKKDRRIYNTFLFDLCKETIAEVYRSEYEKPGPSWTKPNVKTKPAMKLPKTCDELNEYVNKEVATLFGFKTKLQRENMVMRWSRKRRDRVDELLAREAQAEEDEWTKFHHDELAVKNELTVAILDTLIFETTNIVKAAYVKKRRIVT